MKVSMGWGKHRKLLRVPALVESFLSHCLCFLYNHCAIWPYCHCYLTILSLLSNEKDLPVWKYITYILIAISSVTLPSGHSTHLLKLAVEIVSLPMKIDRWLSILMLACYRENSVASNVVNPRPSKPAMNWDVGIPPWLFDDSGNGLW